MPKSSLNSVKGDAAASSWHAIHTPARLRRNRRIDIQDILTEPTDAETRRGPDWIPADVCLPVATPGRRAGLELERRRERLRRLQRPAAAVRRFHRRRIAELVHAGWRSRRRRRAADARAD